MEKQPKAPAMWLYPIADDKGLGVDGFKTMIADGTENAVWSIKTNFRNLSVGDEIVVYGTKTSMGSPSIIGLGIVSKGPFKRNGQAKHRITIEWNLPVSRRLTKRPVDVTWLAHQLPVTKPTVTTLPEELWPKIRELLGTGRTETGSDPQTDIEKFLATSKLSRTEKKQVVDARLGQGVFRSNVASIEQGCRVTGVTDRAHLRASHIKPWRVSTNRERLDGNNGFLLAPHVDHLFDRGFITFGGSGELLISSKLEPGVLAAWALPAKRFVGTFNAAQRRYLEYHRKNVFIVE